MRESLENFVDERSEKFTIEIDDAGNVTISGDERFLRFTAVQALMVLDILKSEEDRLRRLVDEASPIAAATLI